VTSIPGRGNTSKRPDNRRGSELVQFTSNAADRIAKVVRTVERGDTSGTGLYFGRPSIAEEGKVFRVCTFTGAWSINASKVVTLKYQTSTPNTVSAVNLFFPWVGTATTDCAIAREGTAWYLIDVPLATATAIFARSTASLGVLTDISVSASLNSSCEVVVSADKTTTTITLLESTFTSSFLRFSI
jgi:hypothetical protein